ncbi:heme o synthase [Balneatrix alpica]|uniref:Protoheme IX farnesyltransferase n=1 Tax=Balneatrix alpica TaxID=75684 RepID=A0ABV5Z8G6_9GAMM|nr:heme o synthase [Balneatrix alpica]
MNWRTLTVRTLGYEQIQAYYALTKPRVVAVMLLTAVVGMLLADESLPWRALFWGTLGIALSAGSAAAINQLVDSKLDALMARTHRRPLPQGQVSQQQALIFAGCIGTAGITILALQVNPLTAWLTLASLIGYAVIYTAFLKRATPQNITIGGLAGAAPPLLGWTAVTGEVAAESLLLVLIIFAWTPPHFWALALHKKEEYARAGVPMLPVTHGEAFTRLHIVLYTCLLFAVTMFPFLTGMSGWLYLVGMCGLNIRFAQWTWRVWKAEDQQAPMAMFWFSIKYIMAVFAVLLIDHYLTL